ncbi:sex hormone-binding globulin [Salarias fasciatus]|uniref:Sex hormone-binding globulin n=1 Tax=Salarias fasciatus TaxID=181472 RepID=A0A672G6Z7_SALFA|nr:sex hormone-binding globulin [Salarias fasciatus]
MAAFWKALAGGLLLALSLLGRPAESDKNKVSGSSTFYLGQERDIWRPLTHTKINFTDIVSIKSSFQLRTFDPEGTIFYGDTKRGEDWFVLSLKDGVALMQINQLGMLISVTGGPKLNDGKWHTLEVSNQGKFVILEVDGSDRLVVGMQNEHPEEIIQGDLRLALGGILINKDKLIVEYEPQMDGCVRDGVWLNLSIPWETEADRLWPCYQDIQPGSYFPGTGFAVFNTSVFSIAEDDEIKIKLKGEFNQMDGTILSIKAPGQEMMFTSVVNNNTKEITLTYGGYELSVSSMYIELEITIEKDSLTLKAIEDELSSTTASAIPASHPAYGTTWRDGLLAIGGLLGESEGSQFLSGCLKSIQVQGKDLDLDLAHKHMSVSSHSCPA